MKLLDAMCFCNRNEVSIPVAWVREGLTRSCDLPGCGPGCQMFDEPDEYDEPELIRRKYKMSQFDPRKYDPADDSSPGVRAKPEAIVLLSGQDLCACGCGGQVIEPIRFQAGHDITLKGRLIRAQSAGLMVYLLDEETGVYDSVTPLQYAAQFTTEKMDWEDRIRSSVERIVQRTLGAPVMAPVVEQVVAATRFAVSA